VNFAIGSPLAKLAYVIAADDSIVARLRVQALLGNKLLRDLPLERDAVGTAHYKAREPAIYSSAHALAVEEAPVDTLCDDRAGSGGAVDQIGQALGSERQGTKILNKSIAKPFEDGTFGGRAHYDPAGRKAHRTPRSL
jgi:hypothetical protein